MVKHKEHKTSKVWYGVHEVFYNERGKPLGMTEDPITITGESVKDASGYLKMIQRDLKRFPILDEQKTRWAKLPRDVGVVRGEKYKSVESFISELRKQSGVRR